MYHVFDVVIDIKVLSNDIYSYDYFLLMIMIVLIIIIIMVITIILIAIHHSSITIVKARKFSLVKRRDKARVRMT